MAADQDGQGQVPRALRHPVVELEVEAAGLAAPARRRLLGPQQLLQAGQLLGSGAAGGQAGHGGLEEGARLRQLLVRRAAQAQQERQVAAHGGGVEVGDEGAALRAAPDGDEARLGQRAIGLAHRDAAGAQPFRPSPVPRAASRPGRGARP